MKVGHQLITITCNMVFYVHFNRRYIDEILQIRRKTLSSLINQHFASLHYLGQILPNGVEH